MSHHNYPSLSDHIPVENLAKLPSSQHISSEKHLHQTHEHFDPLILNQTVPKSTYANRFDLQEDSQQLPSKYLPNPIMMASFGETKTKQQNLQKTAQNNNFTHFNIGKSTNSKSKVQLYNEHQPQQQEVYESISSDHSSEQKPKPKVISKPLISMLPSNNQRNPKNEFQTIEINKLSSFGIESDTITKKQLELKSSSTLNSGKYNISPINESFLERKSPILQLQRQNIHLIEKKKQTMFKREDSYDLKPVVSQRSNRINIQTLLQNSQMKNLSAHIRSSSQESGNFKLETKRASIKDAPIQFQETKNQSTSLKNLAYVSKKFTSQQPSPKRNDEFNQVYKIQAPLPKVQKKAQQIQEIKTLEPNSNLLYISASGQVVYPSLDLAKKARQIQNKNKQAQAVKVTAQSFSKGQEARKKQEEKRRKSSAQIELPSNIKILQYHSEYFMKIQTQVFQIQVEFPPSNKVIQMKNIRQSSKQEKQQKKSQKNYKIKRRFSDFAFLHQGIVTNQIGYILYPFPSKSLQSFVKIKLQSLIGSALSDGSNATETQKVQLLQKRIQELENFVNFIMAHDQLKHSQELGIFLSQDPEIYQKSRDRIQKYVQEYKELQSSSNLLESGKKNIKKALESGLGMVMKWWGSQEQPVKDLNTKIEKSKQSIQMLVQTTIPQDDIQFGQYFETIGICLAKFQMLQRTMLRLCQINEKYVNFKDIDTEFDYLVKLCTKVSSGKQYSRNIVQTIEYQLMSQISLGRRWLLQSKEQLIKRQQLKELVQTLKSSLTYGNDESSKISKLQRRIQRFQKNFRYGFSELIIESQKRFQRSRIKFEEEWERHCQKMKKIWK